MHCELVPILRHHATLKILFRTGKSYDFLPENAAMALNINNESSRATSPCTELRAWTCSLMLDRVEKIIQFKYREKQPWICNTDPPYPVMRQYDLSTLRSGPETITPLDNLRKQIMLPDPAAHAISALRKSAKRWFLAY